MAEISNEALFDSAMSDEPPEVIEQVIEGEGDTRARDEQGRFTEKVIEPEPKPATQEAKPVEQAQVEPVGVRQLREALERAERRAIDAERRAQPKAEPLPKPDVFENPEGAIKAGAQELVAPLEQKFSTFIETVSRRDAVREHGQDTVTEAFKALDQAANSGDPKAIAAVQAVKQSMDPYGDIVGWYRETESSRNPQAFFQRQLEEALKDDKFKGELMAKLQPAPEAKPEPVFNVPPSLGRAAAAAAALKDGGDLSNESLFAAAMR